MGKIKALFFKYFVEKTDNGYIQFFRYIFVGGTATVADMGTLYVLTSVFHVYYLISAALAFLVGITVNYVISIVWVFKSTGNLKREVTLFFIIGLTGLMLNEVIIWLLVDKFAIFYMYAKLVSTATVLAWNFGLRKKLVFK